MAVVEDAATVLDQFVSDVANLPAEIAHLLEEIEAKDAAIMKYTRVIERRDIELQQWVKKNGALVPHAQEGAHEKEILDHFDKAQALQEDKIILSDKARFLLDRHVKRFDRKIQDLNLADDKSIGFDPSLPSLLHDSPANLVTAVSAGATGTNTPKATGPLTNGANPSGFSANVANAAVARMASSWSANGRAGPPASAAGLPPSLAPLANTGGNGSARRDTSVGAGEKRRRFTSYGGSLPVPSSSLARQSSAGPPSTAKAGTPVSRAGSAGPKKTATKRVAPHQQGALKQRKKGALPGKPRRHAAGAGGARGSPSTTGEDGSDASGSDGEATRARVHRGGNGGGGGGGAGAKGHDGAADDDDGEDAAYDDDGDDTRLYCLCNAPSRGNMVACDNEECEKEWFHWECVGLTDEPQGTWLCPVCRKLPPKKIHIAK